MSEHIRMMDRRNFIQASTLIGLGIGMASFARKKTHILTLSFDDGFRKSFYRIADVHERYGLRACLNVIASGHFPDFKAETKWIPQHLLGNFDDWNELKARGHEVMPHTWDHRRLPDLPLEEAKANIDKCLDYFEKYLDGYTPSNAVYNFAYNASTPELDDYTLKRVRAVRTGGWLVLKGTQANSLPLPATRLRLGCWSKGPDNCDEYVEDQVNNFLQTPGGWLILNLHGLDGEGWGPVSEGYLDGLLKRTVKIRHLDMVPAGEVV